MLKNEIKIVSLISVVLKDLAARSFWIHLDASLSSKSFSSV
jgi:hypothetical protein